MTKELIYVLSYVENDTEFFDVLSTIICKYEENNTPIFIKNLDITGFDLMNLGFVKNEIGICLKKLQETVWRDPSVNNKNKLLEMSKENI